MKPVTRAACLLAVLAFTNVAAADNSATAEALFKEGREALEGGDFTKACQKLAESNRLERAVGTMISLAQCEDKLGKLAAARQHWQEAAAFADAMGDRLKRGDYAREQLAAIDPRVPRLTIKPSADSPPSLTILCDDVSLTSASLGSALPLDAGKHTIVVSTPDTEPRTFDVVLKEGEKRDVEVSPGSRKPALRAPITATTESTPTATSDVGSTHRLVAYGLGGLGVVGLGLGTAFGLLASSSWSDAQEECRRGPCDAGSRAQADKDRASTQGNISTVAFVGGGILVAGAAVVWLIAPSSSSSSSKTGWQLTPGPSGTSAAYRF